MMMLCHLSHIFDPSVISHKGSRSLLLVTARDNEAFVLQFESSGDIVHHNIAVTDVQLTVEI